MLPDTIGRDVFRHLSSARSQLRWMRAVMPQSHGSSARQCANAAGAARSERLRLRQPSAVHAQTHDADLLSGDASSCGRRSVLASITAAGAAWEGRPGAADAVVQIELPDGRQVQAWEFDVPLRVVALRGSVPGAWPADFKAVAGKHAKLAFEQRAQLADIYSELTDGRQKRKSAALADAVTLGDAWLAPAIQQGALQPIPTPERWRWWELLPPRWRQLVRRDGSGRLDPQGAVWGAPYRWGCTLVAYDAQKLDRAGVQLEDWNDLLHPSLRRRVGIIESPREVLSIALRTLGLSPNAGPEQLRAAGISERDIAERLRQLRQQVLVISNREAGRALLAGDIWALVGWSEELVPLSLRAQRVQVVAPASGTMLWADLWAVPAGAGAPHGPSPLLPLWFELPLQPARAKELSQLRKGLSPLMLPPDAAHAQPGTQAVPASGGALLGGYMPGDDVLQRSNFAAPLWPDAHAMYIRIMASL